jgi:hypothetical protein
VLFVHEILLKILYISYIGLGHSAVLCQNYIEIHFLFVEKSNRSNEQYFLNSIMKFKHKWEFTSDCFNIHSSQLQASFMLLTKKISRQLTHTSMRHLKVTTVLKAAEL